NRKRCTRKLSPGKTGERRPRHVGEATGSVGRHRPRRPGVLGASMSAQSGDERLQAAYEAAGPGKERFAIIDLGINPKVPMPEHGRLLTFMPAGMITIGTGNDTWAGGDNNATFSLI